MERVRDTVMIYVSELSEYDIQQIIIRFAIKIAYCFRVELQ